MVFASNNDRYNLVVFGKRLIFCDLGYGGFTPNLVLFKHNDSNSDRNPVHRPSIAEMQPHGFDEPLVNNVYHLKPGYLCNVLDTQNPVDTSTNQVINDLYFLVVHFVFTFYHNKCFL